MAGQQIVTQSIEFLEYAVRDLKESSRLYERMGFSQIGLRKEPGRHSKLYMQGDIKIVLTASSEGQDPAYQFTREHGDGVLTIGYRVPDANEALNVAEKRGARSSQPVQNLKGRSDAAIRCGSIFTFGDVRTAFISHDSSIRFEDLFAEEYRPLDTHKGRFLQTIDHITVNVEKGRVEHWVKFYEELFGFSLVRQFDIRTDKTGLFSKAIRNPNGRVTMPFNEPTDDKSQIQEFIDTFHGPGVQHVAFHTSDIITCLEELNTKGFKFLMVPPTYYQMVPKRVPNVVEDMKKLQELGILVDGSSNGYLLQIFTEPVIGPFFFEFIQRKGDNGFGDGNFRALFEAIERDQMRRGVLA